MLFRSLFVVLANGGYRIMDQHAARAGGAPAWPSFENVDICALARGLGCDARRITEQDELDAALDEVVPSLAGRDDPLLFEVVVAPD